MEKQRPTRERMLAVAQEARGRINRIAALLDVSRPTAYKWIYQLGLQAAVGVGTRDSDDTVYREKRQLRKERKVLKSMEPAQKCVNPNPEDAATFQTVTTATSKTDVKQQRSVAITDSLWRWVKHQAIDTGESVSEIIERAIQRERAAAEKGGAK